MSTTAMIRRVAAATLWLGLLAIAPARAQQSDAEAIGRLKDEAFRRSQVMELMSWLTDVHGPRLTGSPITKAAGDWAVETMKGWGLQNVGFEWWGPFGRGWVNEKFYAQVTSPVPFPVIGYPNAWTPGTQGLVKGGLVIIDIGHLTADSLERWKGRLRGKLVLARPDPEVPPMFEAPGRRLTAANLDSMAAAAPQPPGQFRRGRPEAPAGALTPRELMPFWVEQGVLALLYPGRGSGGTVFPVGTGNRAADAPRAVPELSLAAEHYGRLYRMVEKQVPVEMELDVRNRFYDDDLRSFDIVGEIPGTDKKDELVMIGAHFDSWHTGTGATDNAAGSAVMMEAMRILAASHVPLRRTVRIGLWTGEEQGLIGSREYVKAHFGDPAAGQLKPEQAKVSAYYNVDNGTGAIRGVYLQGNAAVDSIFKAWMKYVDSDTITVRHTTIRNTGGTDHLAFDAVGIPGFQFIQDPIEYATRTHHSNMDVYERIQAADMRHNALVVAVFAYLTANREGLMPRKTEGASTGRTP